MKHEQDDNKRFVAIFVIMSILAVLQLPFTVTEWLRISSEGGDTVPVLLAILVYLVLGFIGVCLLLIWLGYLIAALAKGSEKMMLLSPVFTVQQTILRANGWVAGYKYALPLIIAVQTAMFALCISWLWDKEPLLSNLCFIPFLAGVLLRKGILIYFTTAKGFLALTLFYCLIVSFILSETIIEMYPSISPLLTFTAIFGVLWLIASLIASAEVANVANITLGLGVTFLYTLITYGMAVTDFGAMDRFITNILLANTDSFADTAAFAAYLLLLIGIHALTTAAVTVKGYMLQRLGLREYEPLRPTA